MLFNRYDFHGLLLNYYAAFPVMIALPAENSLTGGFLINDSAVKKTGNRNGILAGQLS
jgi:hypothetical protein